MIQIRRKQLFFISFILVLSCFVVTGVFAEGGYAPDTIIGEWTAYSLFDISVSDEEFELNHMNSIPGSEPVITFQEDGTAVMVSFGESVPCTWEIGDEDKLYMSMVGADNMMNVYIISENILTISENRPNGSGADMMVLERTGP